MNSKNLSIAQNLFSDLSLKTKPTPNNTSSTQYFSAKTFYKSSPEIHDLIRFQNAIMMKYIHTQDPHYRNIANSLTPQIEDKIREFNELN